MARKLSLVLAPVGFLLVLHPVVAAASEALQKHHALSLIGTPPYRPDFTHFDWVNPDAPKGGRVRQMAFGTFDSLNPYSIKGNAVAAVPLIYDRLMTSSPDEASTSYGLVAEWVTYPDDFTSATFQLRASARFHDGRPITPEDVIFSLDALKKASPNYAYYYKNVVNAEKVGDHQVKFTFDVSGNRELPLIVGQLVVLPKHFWAAKGTDGEPRDFAKSTLEVPLGSGPYRIKEVDAGRTITFERVKDWWAKDLPVAKGQWNFDEIKFVYFRDPVPGFQAFKVGEIDYWREASAKNWATGYDFDAIKKGAVVKEKIPVVEVAPMQAFAFNLRRPQFQDARVRHAFNLAFNFEWANKNLFYDEYQRVNSYFDNSPLKATGLPEGRELEILDEIRGAVPSEVFTTEWRNPVNAGPDEDGRKHLAQAAKLLAEAGYTVKDGVLTNAAGVQLKVEFLNDQPDFERIILPYMGQLQKLGIKATMRSVDTPQYQGRVDKFDFDVIVRTFRQSESPGNEQRNFWGSAAADKPGSANVIGIKNPTVDTLIDKVILAKDRSELVAATRALDRVLLWNHYVVPQWHSPFQRLAMWNYYARPSKLPSRDPSFLRVWWWDEAKAKRTAELRG
ncbi:MAG: ABC transporter substrate-binding protein [Hyphomicrobiaceae bacterium]|nr:ABC transporter substrate-binding protein [Hyphomicrobiaceae bacterium]